MQNTINKLRTELNDYAEKELEASRKVEQLTAREDDAKEKLHKLQVLLEDKE